VLTLAPALRALRRVALRRRPLRFRSTPARVPPGLDREEFLHLARLSFLRLQSAWDAADLGTLERLTTGPLLAELREQIAARGAALNRTDVLELQAELLAFEELRGALVASVEFSGLIRECAEGGAAPFRELWLLTQIEPQRGGAWQLAQVQALA
jgi:predicted lipid-binding transport protein (Tim44 family)